MTDLTITTRITDGSADPVTVAERTFTYTESAKGLVTVVNNAAATLWDAAAAGALGDFDLLVLSSDQPVEVEFTVGNGEGTEELSSFRLAKNVAFVLGADDAFRNHSASDAFAGTLDVIDLIRVKETNSVDATVTLSLYT